MSRLKREEERDSESEEEFAFLTSQPSILKNGRLKEHQLVGLNWLISLYEIGINGILADEMGLGKTIQTIAFLAYLFQFKNIKGPHLIVCPNSVLGNWKKEFKKWLPSLNVVKLVPRKEVRYEILEEFIIPGNFDVCLTSFEGINICKKELTRIKWKYIIVDEAHRLKNDESVLSKQLRTLKTDLKLLMTGTPLQNNLRELWSLMNFILPELFDDPELFESYANTEKDLPEDQVEKKNMELITSLHRILRPFILKRTKEVLKQSIPPKKEIHVYLGMTEKQVELYKKILMKKALSDQSQAVKNVLMQLRKCCNHPYLFQGIEEPGLPPLGNHLVDISGKMIVLDKLLNKLKGKHQVLLFSQFTTMLDILEDYFIYKQYKYCRIDGETYIDERERQLEEFTKPDSDCFVFLLSTRAGGLGINLATADTVIIYDSDWNPQVDLQAMDRAHRIGQKKIVNVYRLITENTIEEKIIERQKIKLKWDNLVILKNKMSQHNHKLNKNEMKDLVQFGAKQIFKTEGGTFKEEDIDILLERGEKRAKEMNGKIEKYMEKNGEKLFDLGMDSINVYEFEGDDYQKKRDEDRMMIEKAFENQFEDVKIKKRLAKLEGNPDDKKIKKIVLPDYHFYQEKERLEFILSKEANGKDLSEEEKTDKERLKQTNVIDWNKNDYGYFVRALEKYGKKDIDSIAEFTEREPEEIKNYLQIFFERIEEVADGEKILANLEKMKKMKETKKQNQVIVDAKCKRIKHFFSLKFEKLFYNKIKSKLYKNDHDKYLVYQCFLHGCGNIKEIRKNLVNEPLFRFDLFIRNVKESVLAKRITSLMKMLTNETEYYNSDKYKQLKIEEEQKRIERKKREEQAAKKKEEKKEKARLAKLAKKDSSDKVVKPYVGPMNLVNEDNKNGRIKEEKNNGQVIKEEENGVKENKKVEKEGMIIEEVVDSKETNNKNGSKQISLKESFYSIQKNM